MSDPGVWRSAEVLPQSRRQRRSLTAIDTTVLCNSPVIHLATADEYTERSEAKPTYELYKKIVKRQFSAKKGERNSTLTQKLIPFLFGAVTESVAMEYVEAFYWYNAGIFTDPIELHMAEARAAWDSCETNYRANLTETEQVYFDYICTRKQSDRLIPLFRICRSLSLVETDIFPVGVFAMSGKQCALRIGFAHNEQGKRLLAVIHNKCGVLEVDTYGVPRSKDCPDGIASVYRWMIQTTQETAA